MNSMNIDDLQIRLTQKASNYNVVSAKLIETVPFGKQTQQPKLWDYADNVDTISFLLTT
jgi:hypothetical protein